MYRKDIKIFELKENILMQSAENTNKCVNAGIGDILVCWDGTNVYSRDWNDGKKEQFALLVQNLKFIEINPKIFKLIT